MITRKCRNCEALQLKDRPSLITTPTMHQSRPRKILVKVTVRLEYEPLFYITPAFMMFQISVLINTGFPLFWIKKLQGFPAQF